MGLETTVLGVLTLWGALTLWFRIPERRGLRALGVGSWILFACAVMVLIRGHRAPATLGFAIVFALLFVWWLRAKPSNTRNWADDVAQMTTGTAAGNQVTLRNVRNFDWRTRTDYTVRWETRTYDLDQLTGVDLITSYWSYKAIAHVLVSFGFADGGHVVFSVEVRRLKNVVYSELAGFFKAYELSIIAADERDIIRLRTNVRREDDYLYRLALAHPAGRALFLAYVTQANQLTVAPRFYNTVTANCSMLVYHMMSRIVGHLPLDHRLLLTGYLPGYIHRVGGLDPRHSLGELRALGRITERARAADRNPDFSAAIRAGIPVPSDLTL